MSNTPDYVGGYGRPWLISLVTDSGNDDLTGVSASNISVFMRNSSGVDTTSTGTISIVTSSPAVISWQPTTTDYGTAGAFSVYVKVTFTAGPVIYDPIPLTLQIV